MVVACTRVWTPTPSHMFVLLALVVVALRQAHSSPNILFIAIDDLRPELGAYGFNVSSPNIDALARSGTLFRNAYCQMSVCSPSRASVMTGKRPDTTRVYDLNTYFRDTPGLEDVVTLPQYFKNRGYRTAGMGKIFHPGLASGGNNDNVSWTEPYYTSPGEHRFTSKTRSWQEMTYPKWQFPDVRIGANAASTIFNLKSEKFFIAVGFHKPHLPFVFPQGYLSKYPEATVSLAGNPDPPTGMPSLAWSPYQELRQYSDIGSIQGLYRRPGNNMPADKAKELRRAYWAATSFVDEQVGVVLNALKSNGLEQNTTVVLWGDHGWQLGEHGEWAKSTNFELATRAPLIIRAPSIPQSAGKTVTRVVEHLDIYPTLIELTDYPTTSADGLEGSSLAPLLRDPMSTVTPGVAYSQFTREMDVNNKPTVMGYTLRTWDFRYTEWLPWNSSTNTANWSQPLAYELYDHRGDDGTNMSAFENVNIASQSSGLLPRLQGLLRKVDSTFNITHTTVQITHTTTAASKSTTTTMTKKPSTNSPGITTSMPSASTNHQSASTVQITRITTAASKSTTMIMTKKLSTNLPGITTSMLSASTNHQPASTNRQSSPTQSSHSGTEAITVRRGRSWFIALMLLVSYSF